MEVQLPPNWKGLGMDRYDGIPSPDEHTNVYKTQMSLYTIEKSIWCKVFPTSFKGGVLSWFTQFSSDSVDTQLQKKKKKKKIKNI